MRFDFLHSALNTCTTSLEEKKQPRKSTVVNAPIYLLMIGGFFCVLFQTTNIASRNAKIRHLIHRVYERTNATILYNY